MAIADAVGNHDVESLLAESFKLVLRKTNMLHDEIMSHATQTILCTFVHCHCQMTSTKWHFSQQALHMKVTFYVSIGNIQDYIPMCNSPYGKRGLCWLNRNRYVRNTNEHEHTQAYRQVDSVAQVRLTVITDTTIRCKLTALHVLFSLQQHVSEAQTVAARAANRMSGSRGYISRSER